MRLTRIQIRLPSVAVLGLAIGGAIASAVVGCGEPSAEPEALAGGPTAHVDPPGAGGATDGGPVAPGVPPMVTIRRAGTDLLTHGPQFLAVRKSQTELPDPAHEARCKALLPSLAGLPFLGNGHTCAIFNPYVLDTLKDQTSRRTFFAAGFEEAKKVIGHDSVGNRRLAVEVMLDLLNAPVPVLSEYVDAVLEGARIAKVPVLLNLDAVNWWDGRPELWNFFDPKKPGYDPKNIANVEWVGATEQGAPRAYWRNWGSQIRVETPIPNLGSPTLRAEIKRVMNALMPRLTAFVEGLPPDERYLYAGSIVGTELSIGVNHYYYPNGNAYLGEDPKCDPGLPYAAGCPAPAPGICQGFNRSVCAPNFALAPSGGVAQVGFHAAKDLGLLGGGGPNRGVLDAIVMSYIKFLQATAIEAGLPKEKIFSHTGGIFGANGPHSYLAAEAPGIMPGWSLYYGDAQNPAASAGSYVESSEERRTLPWSSAEWLPLDPAGGTPNEWFNALETSLNYRNNRMISVANWEGVSPNPSAIAGLAQALSAPRIDACTILGRAVLGDARFSDGSAVRFSAPPPGTVTYLTVSSSGTTNAFGALANVNVANQVLEPGMDTKFFATGGPKKVWIQLATDGCARAGAAQRMLSPIHELDVGGGTEPSGALRLYADHRHRIATLSWSGSLGAKLTIELARSKDFASAESVRFDDTHAFYTDGFDPAFPLFARLRDGAAVSNVVQLE